MDNKKSDSTFTLRVNDFGIKYTARKDAEHLTNALKILYKISVNWTERKYIGLNLDWDYSRSILRVSMPEYTPNTLKNLKIQTSSTFGSEFLYRDHKINGMSATCRWKRQNFHAQYYKYKYYKYYFTKQKCQTLDVHQSNFPSVPVSFNFKYFFSCQ